MRADWQRADVPMRTGLLMPYYDHNPSAAAARLASEWAPIVTEGRAAEVGKTAEMVAALIGLEGAAEVETAYGPVTMTAQGILGDAPPVAFDIWEAARRATLGRHAMVVDRRGRRYNVRAQAPALPNCRSLRNRYQDLSRGTRRNPGAVAARAREVAAQYVAQGCCGTPAEPRGLRNRCGT